VAVVSNRNFSEYRIGCKARIGSDSGSDSGSEIASGSGAGIASGVGIGSGAKIDLGAVIVSRAGIDSKPGNLGYNPLSTYTIKTMHVRITTDILSIFLVFSYYTM
jgi:hypothetical protein